MYYPDNAYIPGNEVFGRFVRDLYKLKSNDVKGSKILLNVLWGKLFEKDVSEIESKYNKPIKIKHVNQVKKMFSYHTKKRNPHYKVRIYNNEKTKYKLKHIQGRFVPFMLSLGRRKM